MKKFLIIVKLERALKLLSRKDITEYLDDKSKVIRGAASMLSEYDKSERAQMLRDARAKDELERATIKIAARKEGLEEGRQVGLEEGREQGLEEGKSLGEEKAKKQIVKTMHLNGISDKDISSMIGIDLDTVKRYLSE